QPPGHARQQRVRIAHVRQPAHAAAQRQRLRERRRPRGNAAQRWRRQRRAGRRRRRHAGAARVAHAPLTRRAAATAATMPDEPATVPAPAPYADLTPGGVLDALDGVGMRGDGRLIQLNSYENRVYQAFLEGGRVVVAKFYRPARWSDEQILEEHAFAA